jgi:hypothetical protein
MVVSCLCPKLLTEDSLYMYNSMRLFVLIIADTILLVNMHASLWCCEACVEVFLKGQYGFWSLSSAYCRMKNENTELCLVWTHWVAVIAFIEYTKITSSMLSIATVNELNLLIYQSANF